MVELDVYLGSRLAGRLSGLADQVRFTYAEEWRERNRVEIGRLLPLQAEPIEPAPTRAFFDGLLPEATLREVLARDWRCDPLDTWALLAAIGRESAGAITIMPAGEPFPVAGDVDWLDEAELAEAVRRLPVAPLASAPPSPVRVSLGGAQDKLVLVHHGGRWGLPHPGTASTHIAKPDPARDWLPHLAVNEHVCMHWMRLAGLPAAETHLISVEGRRVLVSTRFDRTGDWPQVERLHQEDFTQLTGRLAIHKYEQHGGPGVGECLDIILDRSADPVRDRRTFLETVWVNALLGNADAHAKNYALLLKDRAWRLAPAYDVVCTLVYDQVDHRTAMRLDGRGRGRWPDPDHMTSNQLADGLQAWGYRGRSRREVAARLVELADRIGEIATPDQVSAQDLEGDEHRLVRLMSREIARRARALRSAASGVA